MKIDDKCILYYPPIPRKFSLFPPRIPYTTLGRKQNVFTFEKCCENLNTRKNVQVIQMFHETFFGLESFRDDLYVRPDPRTVNINHVFLLKKDFSHIGYCQELHGEAE